MKFRAVACRIQRKSVIADVSYPQQGRSLVVERAGSALGQDAPPAAVVRWGQEFWVLLGRSLPE
jgi:hypothetical protein